MLSLEHVVLTDLTWFVLKRKRGKIITCIIMFHMQTRRRELILTTKHTLDCGFSDCSTPTPNGSPSIAYYYKVANVHKTLY